MGLRNSKEATRLQTEQGEDWLKMSERQERLILGGPFKPLEICLEYSVTHQIKELCKKAVGVEKTPLTFLGKVASKIKLKLRIRINDLNKEVEERWVCPRPKKI